MSAKTPAREHRVYTRLDPDLDQALAAAAEAELVPADAPASLRLHAWAMYGFHQWLARRDEALKVAAYTQIAAEKGREELLDSSLDRAMQAGIV